MVFNLKRSVCTIFLSCFALLAFSAGGSVSPARTSKIPRTNTTVPACAPAVDSASSVLWKFYRPGSKPSYLYGTIHLQDMAVYNQRDTVLVLLRSTQVYASELNLDSALSQFDPTMLFYTTGSLYDELDSASVKKVCDELQRKMPLFAPLCSKLKPGAVAILLATAGAEKSAAEPLDMYLWRLAKTSGSQMMGLESVNEQMALFNEMSAEMLLAQLNDAAAQEEAFDALRSAYLREDLPALAEQSVDQMNPYRGMLEKLNDERNMKMASRIAEVAKTRTVFAAIGALHLTGPRSLLRLLQEKGFTVEPVLGGNRRQWLKR